MGSLLNVYLLGFMMDG